MPLKPLVFHCSGGITPDGVQSLPCWFFFSHQQKVHLSKWSLSPKLFSVEAGLTEPLSQELKFIEFSDSPRCFFTATTSSLPVLSSAHSSSDAKTGVSWEGTVWSDLPVSLALCRATKQNFIPALSNWTTLITSVIFFLPLVISPLGLKCFFTKLQSFWTPSQYRVAALHSWACTR